MDTTKLMSDIRKINPKINEQDLLKIVNSIPDMIIPVINKRCMHQKYELNWTYQQIADFFGVSNSLVRQKVENCIHFLLTDYLFLVKENITIDEFINNRLTGNAPVCCLPLKSRTRRVLLEKGIDTVDKLISCLENCYYTENEKIVVCDIAGLTGLGAKGVSDIVNFVCDSGLMEKKDIHSDVKMFAYSVKNKND